MPSFKPIWADQKKRITLPAPVKPGSAWVPIVVTEKELRFVAYEPPKERGTAKGKVVIGKDGFAVWEGELAMDPVEALNQARKEDTGG